MSHDPLCDTITGNDWSLRCDCKLIARVREDERAACIAAIEALPTRGIADGSGFVKRVDAIDALRARGEQA